jgi:hypothetical protein
MTDAEAVSGLAKHRLGSSRGPGWRSRTRTSLVFCFAGRSLGSGGGGRQSGRRSGFPELRQRLLAEQSGLTAAGASSGESHV